MNFMQNYNKLKNQAYKKYKGIEEVYCPYLKTQVRFNSKGFWHTGRNKKRLRPVQLLRFKLLLFAVKLLKITATLQEIETIRKKRRVYYGFIAIISGWKIKVIVKKTGKGKPIFWSIIPNWTTNKKRDRLLLHKGDMESD